MEKFTKGPWKIKDDWMIVESEGRLIAKFEPQSYGISSNGLPESFFNAALIAAAPEMYEILASIKQCLEWGYTNAELVDNMNEYTDKLGELLAKARGEHDN